MCHGQPETTGIRSMDRASIIALGALGAERIRQQIRTGQGQMPPFPEALISAEQLDVLMTFLANPSSGEGRGGGGPRATPLPPVGGVIRYTDPLGSMLRARNGLPAIGPHWAELVAYEGRSVGP